MNKLTASNDIYVEEFLKRRDGATHDVRKDGTIWTKISEQGHMTDEWRKITYKEREGYNCVNYYIWINSKKCRKKLNFHRIVYAKFLGKLEPHMQINHKDGDKNNNHPNNLESVTGSINNLHRYILNDTPNCGSRKITQKQVDEIRQKHNEGWSYSKIIKHYPVKSKGHVSDIINGRIFNGNESIENKIIKARRIMTQELEKIKYWEEQLGK